MVLQRFLCFLSAVRWRCDSVLVAPLEDDGEAVSSCCSWGMMGAYSLRGRRCAVCFTSLFGCVAHACCCQTESRDRLLSKLLPACARRFGCYKVAHALFFGCLAADSDVRSGLFCCLSRLNRLLVVLFCIKGYVLTFLQSSRDTNTGLPLIQFLSGSIDGQMRRRSRNQDDHM